VTASTAASAIAARWTAVAACGCGAALLISGLAGALRAFPGPAALAAVLQLPVLAAGFWLLRLLRPVRSPPASWSAAAVAWGMTAAAGCALVADRGLSAIWARTAGVPFAAQWSTALSAPLNEEILKLSGVALIALMAPLAIRDALDGMIYGALTGLGFQAVQNVTFGITTITTTGATDPARAVAQAALLRAGLTALGSNWAMTAVAGAGIGLLAARGRRGALPASALLATAIAIHLVADLPHATVAVRGLFSLAAVTGVYLVLRHAYLARIRSILDARNDFGMNSERDAAPLLTRRRRRRARRGLPRGSQRDQLAERQQTRLRAIEDQAVSLAQLTPRITRTRSARPP
jgi:RsiW-degrading membrane proteinase PrsW (M82 family)